MQLDPSIVELEADRLDDAWLGTLVYHKGKGCVHSRFDTMGLSASDFACSENKLTLTFKRYNIVQKQFIVILLKFKPEITLGLCVVLSRFTMSCCTRCLSILF